MIRFEFEFCLPGGFMPVRAWMFGAGGKDKSNVMWVSRKGWVRVLGFCISALIQWRKPIARPKEG